MLRKGEATRLADDDVVEHPYIHERQGILQPLGDELIRLTGVHEPGGVIVSEDHCRCVVPKCLANHFLNVHRGGVGAAAKELLERDQAVAPVQEEAVVLN